MDEGPDRAKSPTLGILIGRLYGYLEDITYLITFLREQVFVATNRYPGLH